MRALTLIAAVLLLTAGAPLVTANPIGEGGPFSPVCPLITDLATVCVGGVLQCFVSIRLMGGDRYCL